VRPCSRSRRAHHTTSSSGASKRPLWTRCQRRRCFPLHHGPRPPRPRCVRAGSGSRDDPSCPLLLLAGCWLGPPAPIGRPDARVQGVHAQPQGRHSQARRARDSHGPVSLLRSLIAVFTCIIVFCVTIISGGTSVPFCQRAIMSSTSAPHCPGCTYSRSRSTPPAGSSQLQSTSTRPPAHARQVSQKQPQDFSTGPTVVAAVHAPRLPRSGT
jgi:hypothetical protein